MNLDLQGGERIMLRRSLDMLIGHYRAELYKHTRPEGGDERAAKIDRGCIAAAEELSTKLMGSARPPDPEDKTADGASHNLNIGEHDGG